LTCFNNFRSQECDHCTATPGNPRIRKQKNEKMNYIALASLYGESDGDNILLRQKKGGRLITSQDANKKLVLPRTYDLPSRTSSSESCDPRLVGVCFKSGNGPVNQNLGLTTLITMIHLQHNRIADKLALMYYGNPL